MVFAAFLTSRTGAHLWIPPFLPRRDYCCRESFDHVEKWLDDLTKHLDVSTVTKIIVGNKSDLHSKRVVQYDEGLALAQKLNLECVTTQTYLSAV